MRLRQFHQHQPAAKINVTPLIDVVMVLIVFYLIVGKLAADRRAVVELPSTGVGTVAEEKAPGVSTVAGTDSGGARVLIDGVETPVESLEGLLRARVGGDPAGTVVQVRADRRLASGAVEPVVRACRGAGLTAVQLVTEKSR